MAASAEPTVSFRIHDHRDPAEIDEVTQVYIDGQQIGTFRLGPDRADDAMTVSVSPDAPHRYALCGRVTVRGEDGGTVTREVNGAGELTDVAGREYDAVAANNFTIFYLRDITEGRAAGGVAPERTRACMPNVSDRGHQARPAA